MKFHGINIQVQSRRGQNPPLPPSPSLDRVKFEDKNW